MRCPALACFVLSLVAACSSDPAGAQTDPTKPPLGLEGATLIPAADNPVTAAKVELGKQLFFDPRLSGTGKMSCSSCHLPELAFTDGKALSTKDDGKVNTRNSPSMHNVGYLERLYWDGRATTLEGNVKAAWTAQIGGKPDEVAVRLGAVAQYAAAFQAAFGAPPREDTIVKALASFLRTLRSGDSAFDRFVAGQQDAISADAKQGYELFRGKGACLTCHQAPLFTDRLFHNTGIGMKAEKPDLGAAGDKAFNDPAKTGAFKTPSLRDVDKTAPYFHDGSVKTLEEAVKFMAGGGLDNPHRDPLLRDVGLTDAERAQIVAFLKTLTGNQKFEAPAVPK
jgi:cytochrome c peroxidase